MPSIQQDQIELQCAFLKEMGLTYGKDANKVKGLILDMENKDDMMAAERGIKKHQQSCICIKRKNQKVEVLIKDMEQGRIWGQL